MIVFLLKGLIRDPSRSLFPLLIVIAGVSLTVVLHAWMNGAVLMMTQSAAHFSTGHVRVMTRAYAKEVSQIPNDLALLGLDTLLNHLRTRYPDLLWTPRIKFGGILDVPDERGETRVQAPVFGTAVNIMSPESPEWWVLNLRASIVTGRVPQQPREILIADELAARLHLHPGDTVTLMSSTMYGSMALMNFAIAGTVRFGVSAMDRAAIIADVADIQQALDMVNGAGEILGFFPDDVYHEERASAVAAEFNKAVAASDDPFAPVMGILRYESGLADYFDTVEMASKIVVGVFLLAMSIVLWNTGLTGNLRRYGEMGLRLAIGEAKDHVYWCTIIESLLIGVAGSTLGTAIGLAVAYYLQTQGIDFGSMMEKGTMMIPSVIRARITPVTYGIGFIPGVLATLLGSAISGRAIYRRQTAQLFKELEA